MKQAFIHGRIFTSADPARTGDPKWAQAMIVDEGRITWIGSDQDLPREDLESVDLKGRTVIPGIVDCHMHPVTLAENMKEIACLPPAVNSIEELTQEIARVRRENEQEDVILGWGYDEGKFAEKRSPNRRDLDVGCSDRPVILTRSCCHIKCANSKALELAGITRDTPDPEGGSIERDENGEPTGVLRETARYMLDPVLPPKTRERTVSQLIDLGQLLLSQGIVGICEMGTFSDEDAYGYYTEAAEQGFQQEVGIYYMWDYFRDGKPLDFSPEKTDKNNQIRNAGVKIIGDGSVSGHTAWVYEPYLTGGNGMMTITEDHLDTAIEEAKKNHVQLSVHAMGGRTIDYVIDRVCREKNWMKEDEETPFLRMEHITEPSQHALEMAASHGIYWCSQPIFLYSEVESYRENLAPERIRRSYPWRSMLDSGVKLALSTDAPATSWAVPSDPFPNLKCAVTRRAWDGYDLGQDQKLDMETAIRLYTAGASEAGGFKDLGRLLPGYKASFAVLDRDIFGIPAEEVDLVKVEATYVKGEAAFTRQHR